MCCQQMTNDSDMTKSFPLGMEIFESNGVIPVGMPCKKIEPFKN